MPVDREVTTLYCSFCGKSQHEVKKLIAGPTVFICEECIVLCASIICENGLVNSEDLPTETQLSLMQGKLQVLLNRVHTVLEHEERRHEPFKELAAELQKFDEITAASKSEPKIVELEGFVTPDGC